MAIDVRDDPRTQLAVWSDRARDFVAVEQRALVCPACGRSATDLTAFWWDEVIPREPFLQCACGEQYGLYAHLDRP